MGRAKLDLQAVGNRPDEVLIGPAVGVVAPSGFMEPAIAAWARLVPLPAAAWEPSNMRQEPLF
jgi:hypothetical protein